MGALRYHYYEIRTLDDRGNVVLTGRAYDRELDAAEVFAVGMALGGPTAKVRYLGGGTHPFPPWWAGSRESWSVMSEASA